MPIAAATSGTLSITAETAPIVPATSVSFGIRLLSTSASFVSSPAASSAERGRQYLHPCTSKASKVSTCLERGDGKQDAQEEERACNQRCNKRGGVCVSARKLLVYKPAPRGATRGATRGAKAFKLIVYEPLSY